MEHLQQGLRARGVHCWSHTMRDVGMRYRVSSASCVLAVHASPHTAVMSRQTPVAVAPRLPRLPPSARANMPQPAHTPTAASTCTALYLAPINMLLMNIVGSSFEDLATTLTGKETCAMAALPAP